MCATVSSMHVLLWDHNFNAHLNMHRAHKWKWSIMEYPSWLFGQNGLVLWSTVSGGGLSALIPTCISFTAAAELQPTPRICAIWAFSLRDPVVKRIEQFLYTFTKFVQARSSVGCSITTYSSYMWPVSVASSNCIQLLHFYGNEQPRLLRNFYFSCH